MYKCADHADKPGNWFLTA